MAGRAPGPGAGPVGPGPSAHDVADLLRHRPLVFVDDLDQPVLDDGDRHHFERVLRVAPGADIVVGDGAGAWRPARFGPRIEPTGPVSRDRPHPYPVTVAFAPVKGAKPEWVVQKLTEIGVDRIQPVLTERTVVRWDEARRRRMVDRMLVAAREACLQSRRLTLPEVAEPCTLGAHLAREPGVVLADPGGSDPSARDRSVVVGPEGGLTADEVADRPTVRLPGHVLRAETAVVVAAGVLVALRGGLVHSSAR